MSRCVHGDGTTTAGESPAGGSGGGGGGSGATGAGAGGSSTGLAGATFATGTPAGNGLATLTFDPADCQSPSPSLPPSSSPAEPPVTGANLMGPGIAGGAAVIAGLSLVLFG